MKSKLFLLILLSITWINFLQGDVPLPKPKSAPSPFDKKEQSQKTPPAYEDSKAPEEDASDAKVAKPQESKKESKAPDSPKFFNPFLKKNKKVQGKASDYKPSDEDKKESKGKTKTLVPSYRGKKEAKKPSTKAPPYIPPSKAKEQESKAPPYIIQEAKEPEKTAEKAPEKTDKKPSSYKPPKVDKSASSSKPTKKIHKKVIPGTDIEGYTINFNKIGITEFIRFVGEIAKVNFIFHEDDLIAKKTGRPFTITLVSEEPARVSDIMTMLLQTLQSHGLSLMDRGDNVVIYKSSNPTKLARVVTSDAGVDEEVQIPIVTRVFTLKTSNAKDISDIITSLLSKNAQVQVSDSTNQIIITDLSQNIHRVDELISALDRPFGDLEVGKYVVEASVPSELVTVAQQILLPLSDGKPLIMVPHNTSESIFIVASPFLIDKSIKVLAALDIGTPISGASYDEEVKIGGIPQMQTGSSSKKSSSDEKGDKNDEDDKDKPGRSKDGKSAFLVHKLRHHKGNTIASSLNEIGTSLKGLSGDNNELIHAISSMRWIPSSNSLIITGSDAAVEKVKRLVSSLDSPLRQVFIEMLILETSVQSSFGFGVQWGIKGTDSNNRFVGATAIDTGATGGNGLIDAITNKATNLPAGFGLGVIGDLLVHNGQPLASFGALIDAIQTDNETSILMNPRLITQDAKAAEIFVGVNVPYKSATIQPNIGEATTEFEYRNVGTRLVVTPYLGNSDLVTLEISQDISEIADQQTNDQTLLNQNTPKSSTTSTNTTVHVPDNHFLMISGMIRSSTVRGHAGVPCFGGVPLLSDVSGSKRYTKQKSNIIIFIRPHIINTEKELTDLTKEQNALFESQKKLNTFEKDKDEIFNVMDMYHY